jgi:Ala-tRNA(Pro) deacylase
MSKQTLQEITHLFRQKNITHSIETHPEIPRDSHGAAKVRGSDVTAGAKALVLRADNTFVQAIVPAHKKTNFKPIKEFMKVKRVFLASPADVLEETDCVVGSVPPLGILWNMPVFVDEEILMREEVVFSAGTLTESIHVSPQELVRVNEAHVMQISKKN